MVENTSKLYLKILFLTLIFVRNNYAQTSISEIPLNLQTETWSASWIAPPKTEPNSFGVYHFRKKVNLTTKPKSFIIHVSGDNRYKLFVNGQLVSLGPARSDVQHWHFETVDIAPFLKEGENILASVVWNFGKMIPLAQHSFRTGFILQGNSENERIVDTDSSWKCIKNEGYSIFKNELNTFFAVGPGEKVEFDKYPWNWESISFDDTKWQKTEMIKVGLMWNLNIGFDNWTLTPRTIPPMEMKPQRLQKIRKVEGMEIAENFLKGTNAITVPANSKVTILLDQTHLTTAYPTLLLSKGKNAKIVLSYAESLFEKNPENPSNPISKDNRDQIEGKIFFGYKDEFVADGGEKRTISPLWWRTYRYVEMTIETVNEPLILEDFYGIFTAYPLEKTSTFQVNDNKEIDKFLEIGWRTARLCANETYMDCPYYEQLQYAGDVRIQAMVTMYNSSDDRLVRNAITKLSQSLSANGLTMSRYPSNEAQFIPTFSIWWIGMLNDYWRYRGDAKFVKSFLPASRMVINYFTEKQHSNGSLKRFPEWSFTDWAKDKNWQIWGSIAPYTPEGNSAPLDLQLLLTLQMGGNLEKDVGMIGFAEEYKNKAELLKKTIRELYWDKNLQLFSDTPEKKYYSQHTNLLAILTEVVVGNEARNLMEKVLTDKNLVQTSIFFKYYLHAALVKVGMGDKYISLLNQWREQMKDGLTTWAETFEPSRSDCHAWGASPNVELYRILLGIDSDSGGFKKVIIAPNLGEITKISGSIPHPDGIIEVNYLVDNLGKLSAEISLPKGISGRFIWKGTERKLVEGKQILVF
jgi:alpha-L-rhamnosidase